MLTRHCHAGRMDDVGLEASGLQPPCQPETVAAGLVGDDHPADRPAGTLGLDPPAGQQLLQRRRIGVQFLQRPARDTGQCAGDQPACVTQLDHRDHCGLLVKGHKRTAQIIDRLHRGRLRRVEDATMLSDLQHRPHSFSPEKLWGGRRGRETIVVASEPDGDLHGDSNRRSEPSPRPP
jgi:hypothetical protein